MAKGDHQRIQNNLDYQGGTTQNNLDNLRTNLTRQNQGLENRFNVAADQSRDDYNNLQGMNSGLMNYALNGPMHNFGAYGGYQNFANTGGYSPDDIAAIRARSIAPIRATYANANSAVDRAKSLAGGYSPNYVAAKAKMARDLSYALGDQTMNTEAALADQIRQGKLSGLGGMTNIDAALLNAETSRLGQAGQLAGNMTSLYGAAPGQSKLYGDLLNQSSQLGLGTEQLQEQKMRDMIAGFYGMGQTAGNFQSAMGNLSSILGLAGDIGSIFSPYGGLRNVFGGGGGVDLNTRPYGPGY